MKPRKSPVSESDLLEENFKLKLQVNALKGEIFKLQKKNVLLEAKQESMLSEIKALKKLKTPITRKMSKQEQDRRFDVLREKLKKLQDEGVC